MKLTHFLSSVEHERIHQAIRAAETGTSGDIVLFITHDRVEDPVTAADQEFRKLGLETGAKKNALLIFLAPKSQKFAIVGGTALHEKVGQRWWDELVALLGRHFKAESFTDGLVAVIQHAGHALQKHFPAGATDRTGERDIVEE
jgi:uncharacterized membrane protein